ncbi:glycoside hydrolase family 19 protein [Nocardia sp. alder85J]|uniref:glycoside hydrolase family 19 protein n=1 Tax=Nocardia sp. alder85J TaxID=2862949 RepID=UPI001CD21F64|nr:glycoside hydrolase family 19 protein [Nocardia sp. alder85J]MCX4097213.1 hypothetical protein [Nocardia sp. alder85J]
MTPPRMPPPRSVVEAWRALEAALGLRGLFDRFLCDAESLSGAVRTECHRLDGEGWQGTAYDTVLDHVEAAHRRNRLLWDRVATLRDTGATALTDLHYTALAALDYAADAEAAGCTVADDWTVTAEQPAVAGEWSELLAEAVTAVTRSADRGRTAVLTVSDEINCLAAMFGLVDATSVGPVAAAAMVSDSGGTAVVSEAAEMSEVSDTGGDPDDTDATDAEWDSTAPESDAGDSGGSTEQSEVTGEAEISGSSETIDDAEEIDDMGYTDDNGPADDPVPHTDRESTGSASADRAEVPGRLTMDDVHRSPGSEGTLGGLSADGPDGFRGSDVRSAGIGDDLEGDAARSRYRPDGRVGMDYFEPADLDEIDSGQVDLEAFDRASAAAGPADAEVAETEAIDAEPAAIGSTAATSAIASHAQGGPIGSAGGITLAQLVAIMPQLSPDRAAEYLPALNAAMLEGGITTPLRQAAFLAQLAHESGQLQYFEELGGAEYFGQYDPGQPNAAPGNTEPGDGPLFHGRGPIQLTGRGNYRDAGLALGLDLEGDPEAAARPDIGFRVAQWYWRSRAINALADLGDFAAVTAAVNGGYNGLAERESFYRRALEVLG